MKTPPSSIRKISILLLLLEIVLSYIVVQNIPASKEQNKITIYHTNDMHGALDSRYTPEGKLTQIGADVVKSLKDCTPNSILVDAGDATQGGMLASSSQGSKIVELMNAAGYDIMALGNHEFDYGVDALKLNSTLAKFKMISANSYNEENQPILASESNNGCNVIMEINGKKLGFFGLTTCGTRYTTNPKSIESVTFKDEVETAQQQYKYLREQKCDIIICIAHIGTTEPEITTEVLANKVPGIDIIIDGHSHEVYSKTVGHTIIQQTGTKSKSIGKIEIEFIPNGEFNINTNIIKAGELINPLEANNYQCIPDSKISSLCRDMMQKVSESFRIIIGKTDSGLYGGEYKKTRICRLQDTNLGNLIGDALVHHGKDFLSKSGIAQNLPVVSLQNGGGIRTSIFPKFISVGDIINVFPFPNRTAIKLINSNQLYEILENGFKTIHMQDGILVGPDGAFPNVGGMRIEFDLNGEPMKFNEEKTSIVSPGSRVKKIVLLNDDGSDGTELNRDDRETQLAIVTNNFETIGGDQYIMLKNFPSLNDEDVLLKDAFCDYVKLLTFKNGGTFNYPAAMSRVKLINSEQLFKNYDITLTIKENSKELKNQDIQIQIDDNNALTKKTDDNGNIIIENLEQGPHDIKVTRGNHHMNAYVNNRVGINTADIFLENTMEQDVDNIINIINGISQQKISDIKDYVLFARNSYDSLPEENKSSITNYDSLLKAEKANNALNSNNKDEQDILDPTPDSTYTIMTIFILLFVTYLIIHKSKSQKYTV